MTAATHAQASGGGRQPAQGRDGASAAGPGAGPLLSVRDLSVSFPSPYGRLMAVDRASFEVAAGETLAIVGESGSGKSTAALAVACLLPPERSRVEAASILFEGEDLQHLSGERMRAIRGRRLGMIFQDPMTSLNPVMTVGDQIGETLRFHEGLSVPEARRKAVGLLERVRIAAAGRRAGEYPHSLSGGMRQRVMIAMALACGPRLLLADEPTTALDVTTQAQILELLLELQEEMGMAIVLITHDLGVVAEMADRVAVLYCGRVVETAPTRALFDAPAHPYTRALLRSVKSLHARAGTPLYSLQGRVPPLHARPAGCVFRPRCDVAAAACALEPPQLAVAPGHAVACIHAQGAGPAPAAAQAAKSPGP